MKLIVRLSHGLSVSFFEGIKGLDPGFEFRESGVETWVPGRATGTGTW